MTNDSTVWAFRLAFALLALGFGAWAIRLIYSDPATALIWKVLPPVLGIGFGYFAASVAFPYSADVAVVGFPFPVALFKREGVHWIDYISDQIALALIADCAVGVGVVSVLTLATQRALLRLRGSTVTLVALGGAAWAVESGQLGPLSFDPRGADFTLWVGQFKDQLYQHWPPRTGVPDGARGRVVLRFTVTRNGALQDIRVKKARGARELQAAAQEALRASRFLPLPAAYKREDITMSLDFYLNEEPPGAVQSR